MTVIVDDELLATPAESLVREAVAIESSRACVSYAVSGRPAGLATGPGDALFISDATSGTIWHVDEGGVRVLARAPGSGLPDVAGLGWVLRPAGLVMGPDGVLVVADTVGHRVWAIAPDGTVSLFAGSEYGYRDGPAREAQFRSPSDVAIGPDGTYYVADTENNRIRCITPDGLVSTLAGSLYDYGDGRGAGARFRRPEAVTVDGDGICYVADTGNHTIRRITPDGHVTTLAGSPLGGDRDGVGTEARLRWPTGLAMGPDGDLWVADHGNGTLRRIERDGATTTSLRLSARRWPVAVAALHGAMVVAAVVFDDPGRPETCLVSVEVGK